MDFGGSCRIAVTRRLSPIRVFFAGKSWRLFGSRRSAETLLQAMSGDDEQNRMLAGISLLKAGRRSLDLIEEKAEAGEVSAPIIRLLPDIGGARAREVLDRIASRPRDEMSDTARQCLASMQRIDAP